jgi:hypothetical protein
MRNWLVEFTNGRTFAVSAKTMSEAICKAIENLTRAVRVKAVHEVAA